MTDVVIYKLYYVTLQPILQPTETAPAYKINLQQIIGDRPRQKTWHPDKKGKVPRGNDERRIGQEKNPKFF